MADVLAVCWPDTGESLDCLFSVGRKYVYGNIHMNQICRNLHATRAPAGLDGNNENLLELEVSYADSIEAYSSRSGGKEQHSTRALSYWQHYAV